jgi:tripartite-type tricarboxylate transporter receptor subunit TctC
VKERLANLGIFPFTTPTPAAFGDYIKSEIAKYGKVVRESGIRVD